MKCDKVFLLLDFDASLLLKLGVLKIKSLFLYAHL